MHKADIGSDFDQFLREEGIFDVVEATAIKRVIAHQIEIEMKRKSLSKAELARLMKTSRASIDRLLDPDVPSVTLQTLGRAAAVLGKTLKVTLS